MDGEGISVLAVVLPIVIIILLLFGLVLCGIIIIALILHKDKIKGMSISSVFSHFTMLLCALIESRMEWEKERSIHQASGCT